MQGGFLHDEWKKYFIKLHVVVVVVVVVVVGRCVDGL